MKSGINIAHHLFGGGLAEIVDRVAKTPECIVGILRGTGEHSGDSSGFFKALGITRKSAEHNPTVAEVGWWNEYGTKTIPSRPFLRSTIRDNHKKYTGLMLTMLPGFLKGTLSKKQFQGRVGMQAQSDIKKAITDWSQPPNAIKTQVLKGAKLSPERTKHLIRKSMGKTKKQIPDSDIGASVFLVNNPLIDTGQLRNSIHYLGVD